MKPTIGRIVIYKTTEADRTLARTAANHNVQEELPAIVVAVWSETCINVRVFSDGNSLEWKTSILQGEQEGQWHWPVVVFANPK